MASDISYEKEKLLPPSIEREKDLEIGQEPSLSPAPPSHQNPSTYLYLWIVLNILATVSIL
ncbi:hypothetical protein MW887_004277 [Aspergillus wentii]|nr:hypothetical protein MW887_004277 [Aspergillus wentii]